jgi:hypothetical protein
VDVSRLDLRVGVIKRVWKHPLSHFLSHTPFSHQLTPSTLSCWPLTTGFTGSRARGARGRVPVGPACGSDQAGMEAP